MAIDLIQHPALYDVSDLGILEEDSWLPLRSSFHHQLLKMLERRVGEIVAHVGRPCLLQILVGKSIVPHLFPFVRRREAGAMLAPGPTEKGTRLFDSIPSTR
jgi:hypothetical protein